MDNIIWTVFCVIVLYSYVGLNKFVCGAKRLKNKHGTSVCESEWSGVIFWLKITLAAVVIIVNSVQAKLCETSVSLSFGQTTTPI